MTNNYKSCPLKKRPIVYVEDKQEKKSIDQSVQKEAIDLAICSNMSNVADQPQDLSVKKRKASESLEESVVPAKRIYVLNLSKKSPSATAECLETSSLSKTEDLNKRFMESSPLPNNTNFDSVEEKTNLPSSLVAAGLEASSLSKTKDLKSTFTKLPADNTDFDSVEENNKSSSSLALSSPSSSPSSTSSSSTAALCLETSSLSNTYALNNTLMKLSSLVGNTNLDNMEEKSHTANPYEKAFVMAAGCNPLHANWNIHQPSVSEIYPSPASSTNSSTDSSQYAASTQTNAVAQIYQQFTPPPSPISEANSEPMDLSMRHDFNLPAFYLLFEQSTNTILNSSDSPACSPSRSSITSTKYRFKCSKCNKMYSTPIGLSKHQQFHCPAAECNQNRKQHSCEQCGKSYTTKGALKMHIRTHTLPCKCPICGKATSRPWLLQGHIRSHTGEKPFTCPVCSRAFADRSNLRAHQQIHEDIKKYICSTCDRSFSRKSLLNKHNKYNCSKSECR